MSEITTIGQTLLCKIEFDYQGAFKSFTLPTQFVYIDLRKLDNDYSKNWYNVSESVIDIPDNDIINFASPCNIIINNIDEEDSSEDVNVRLLALSGTDEDKNGLIYSYILLEYDSNAIKLDTTTATNPLNVQTYAEEDVASLFETIYKLKAGNTKPDYYGFVNTAVSNPPININKTATFVVEISREYNIEDLEHMTNIYAKRIYLFQVLFKIDKLEVAPTPVSFTEYYYYFPDGSTIEPIKIENSGPTIQIRNDSSTTDIKTICFYSKDYPDLTLSNLLGNIQVTPNPNPSDILNITTTHNQGVNPYTSVLLKFNNANESVNERSVLITITTKDSVPITLFTIYAYLAGKSVSTKITCIDINEGKDVDSNILLYSSSSSHIYRTLESKDNTLFLGNYKDTYKIDIIKEIDEYITEYGLPWTIGSQLNEVSNFYYEDGEYYVPNLYLSSLDRKVFRYGETYALGLVFVNKDGSKSSVYYIGLQTVNDTCYAYHGNKSLYKRIFSVSLTPGFCKYLYDNGVRAVIPVYAVPKAKNRIVLGFVTPTIVWRNYSEAFRPAWFFTGEHTIYDVNKESKEPGMSWYDISTYYDILAYGTYNAASNVNRINSSGDLTAKTHDSEYYIYRALVTLNTPEVEVSNSLSESELANTRIEVVKFIKDNPMASWSHNRSVNAYRYRYYLNNVDGPLFTYSSPNKLGKRAESLFDRIDGWRGFVNFGYYDWSSTYNNDYSRFIERTKSNISANELQALPVGGYHDYYIYVWNRQRPGGELDGVKIVNKVIGNQMVFLDNGTIDSDEWHDGAAPTTLSSKTDSYITHYTNNARIVRDIYSTSTYSVATNFIYQGNVDLLINYWDTGYRAWTTKSTFDNGTAGYPRGWTDNEGHYCVEAGIDYQGLIKEGIAVRYCSSPHIVLALNDFFTTPDMGCAIVDLVKNNTNIDYYENNLDSHIWVKCGDLQVITSNTSASLYYKEGDYFYGRFYSLRTYPWTTLEVNGVIDVVSCFLYSTVNLDLRTDVKRGVLDATLNPNTNYNQFNHAYDLLNNFFNYSYVKSDNVSVDRDFKNSIQWSLLKTFGADVDEWAKIQDVNTLDLDGDAGELISIKRLNDKLIAFLENGISLILYNENMQLSTTDGIPVEIGNSGKVNGKRYIAKMIGCQNPLAITTTPYGIYFIDRINRNFYMLTDGNGILVVDICSPLGMKSWALANLDREWWLYYDVYAQEVMLIGELEGDCLLYSDSTKKFQCFSNYENINYPITLDGRVYLRKSVTIDSNPSTTIDMWLRNGQDAPIFFNTAKPMEIEFVANTLDNSDKTFTTVCYRADGFGGESNQYLDKYTFDTIEVSNEYQTTLEINITSSNTKKKFRIWRIDIPRAKVNNSATLDRIRNPWCHVKLTANMDNLSLLKLFMIHDFEVAYVD